jgi:hypothetical protein
MYLACSFNCYLLCTGKTKRTKQISSNLQSPSSLPPPPPKVIPGVRQHFFVSVFCFAPEIGNATGYVGTITVNSELDSASNDIYFFNMQLFPW